MYARAFLVFVGGFTVGILYRSFFSLGVAFLGALLLLGAIFALSGWFFVGNRKQFFFVALFFFAAFLGGARYELLKAREDRTLDSYLGQIVSLRGAILDEADFRENHVNYSFAPDTLITPNEETLTRAPRVLILANLFPRYQYGDEILVRGELVAPKNFPTDGDRQFDYVRYLEKDGVRYQMFRPEVTLVGREGGSIMRRGLFALKRKFLSTLEILIPEPESSLAGGLIVGAKQSLGKELLEKFRLTGVVHIVVLSGYNLSVVSDNLIKMFGWFLPRGLALFFGAFGIVLFTLMTGAGPATVRAAIMAIIAVIARERGRAYQATNALLLAGLIMMYLNPAVLVFDTGFQLSFLATLGLIYIAPLLERKVPRVPERFLFIPLRELLVTTVAAQIAVLPWLLYKIGDLSLVALPVNLLILGFVPLTMFLGFLTGFIGFLSTSLALPFAWATHGLLSYELWVVDLFSQVPMASVHVAYFPVIFVVVAYAGLGYVVWKNKETFGESTP